jgi:hypothetical protein
MSFDRARLVFAATVIPTGAVFAAAGDPPSASRMPLEQLAVACCEPGTPRR